MATFLIVLCGPVAGTALASGPVGADPSSNFPVGALPSACDSDPTGAVCINASVDYLNQARASLGQPAYSLPSDFASLTPMQQTLILTNSDRLLYNLAPITGLTDELNQDAAAGMLSDSDPRPSTSDWYGYTSNAAWGQANIVLAYEGYMYDDGPGSDNVDCTPSQPSGCWGHRHDILWQFGPGALAMGAAAGSDASGNSSYTMLLMQGSPAYNPLYTYTWAQAQADGAGNPTGSAPSSPAGSSPAGDRPLTTPIAVGARAGIRIKSLRVRGHRVALKLAVPRGTALRCSLTRVHGRLGRSRLCHSSVTFGHLRAGTYRLVIRSSAGIVRRRVVVG